MRLFCSTVVTKYNKVAGADTLTWYTGCTKVFLVTKYRRVSQYTSKSNLIYAHKKGVAFPTPIFTKLTNVERHDMQNYYAESHQIRIVNVKK